MFVQTSIPEWFSSRNVSAWTDKEYTYTVCPRDKKNPFELWTRHEIYVRNKKKWSPSSIAAFDIDRHHCWHSWSLYCNFYYHPGFLKASKTNEASRAKKASQQRVKMSAALLQSFIGKKKNLLTLKNQKKSAAATPSSLIWHPDWLNHATN